MIPDNRGRKPDLELRVLYHHDHSYLMFKTGDDPELTSWVTYSLYESKRRRQYRNRIMNSSINLFFITLLRNHSADVVVPNLLTRQEEEYTVLILKYMQEHYSTVTLKELANFFNYSERHIQRLIKESTGLTFSQNIQKRKLRQEASLLENTDLSITEISNELGYSAPENFRHAFKNHTEMNPMKYRAEHHHNN